MLKFRSRTARAGAVLGVALLALVGCSSAESNDTETQLNEADSVTVEDAWVGSAEPGEMTAAYGTLENSSEHEVTVTAVESSASPVIELHETVENDSGQMVMQEIDGGFVIPADDHLHLEPGGNHFMLMELPEAVLAGDEVSFTLTFSDGSTLEFTAAVRDHAGGHEDYAETDDHGDMGHDESENGDH